MFYETLGQGSPLLLLHGWMQIGRDLLLLAQALASEYRVILPDLPGYGRSVPSHRTFPTNFYERDADIMCEFVDALELKNLDVLGYSDGGEVALLMGVTRPELFRSIVTWGAVGYLSPDLCDYAQNVMAVLPIGGAERKLHPGQDVAKWPRQWTESFCAMIAAGGDISLSRAAQMQASLLLMVGDQDTLNSADAGRSFVEAAETAHHNMPNPKPSRMFRVFAQTGHAIHEERPTQFIETAREFLRLAP